MSLGCDETTGNPITMITALTSFEIYAQLLTGNLSKAEVYRSTTILQSAKLIWTCLYLFMRLIILCGTCANQLKFFQHREYCNVILSTNMTKGTVTYHMCHTVGNIPNPHLKTMKQTSTHWAHKHGSTKSENVNDWSMQQKYTSVCTWLPQSIVPCTTSTAIYNPNTQKAAKEQLRSELNWFVKGTSSISLPDSITWYQYIHVNSVFHC